MKAIISLEVLRLITFPSSANVWTRLPCKYQERIQKISSSIFLFWSHCDSLLGYHEDCWPHLPNLLVVINSENNIHISLWLSYSSTTLGHLIITSLPLVLPHICLYTVIVVSWFETKALILLSRWAQTKRQLLSSY